MKNKEINLMNESRSSMPRFVCDGVNTTSLSEFEYPVSRSSVMTISTLLVEILLCHSV